MKTKKFFIENLKCQGCANSIKHKIMAEDGVTQIEIDFENSSVEIVFDPKLISEEHIVQVLEQMGYPSPEDNNFSHKMKSYVSCAIGRVRGGKEEAK